jgi:predicted secreted protein
MYWPSALAIYLLFWVMAAFLVMPFHVHTADETGEALVPGQAESAPSDFRPKRILVWTTIVGTVRALLRELCLWMDPARHARLERLGCVDQHTALISFYRVE